MNLRAGFYVFLITGIVLLGGTAIAANTHIQTDGTLPGADALNINTPGSGHPYTLSEINGKLSGHNLFYSFSNFSIGITDTALFKLNTSDLANVISRVTGGSESLIDGKLQMTNVGSTPSFYFINPAGITFGSGASVDVPGSFYVSTASGVNFSDGSQWTVSESHASTLSAANPESFGFLGNEGGNINIGDANPTNLTFKPGATVVFAGNDIHIDNTVIRNEAFTKDTVISNEAFSKAGLDLQFFATGSKAMNLKSGIPVEKVTAGDLYITNSFLDPSGNGLGRILTSSGNLFSSSSDFWVVNTANLSMGNDQGINLYADSMTANNGTSIVSEAVADGAGGAVIITAGTFNLENGSAVRSKTTSQAASGDILINTKSLEINKSNITNTTEGSGDTGNIVIKTDSLLINDGSGIVLFTSAEGNADALTIDSKLIAMDKGFIANGTSGDGKAGDINIDTGVLKVSYSGEIDPDFKSGIDAGTFANGNGGNVTVNADQIEMTHGFIASSTEGKGVGSAVFLKANSLVLKDSGIVSNTLSRGAGGLVSIEVENNLSMINSNITSATISDGNAGSVNLLAGTVWMDGGSHVSSLTTERGNAGRISINANELTITNNSVIRNEPFGEGDGGSILIDANELTITNNFVIQNKPFGEGDGGIIKISASALYLNNGSLILSSPSDFGKGSSGSILIAAKLVEINNGTISNVAFDTSRNNAGNINIQSDVFEINEGLITTSTLAIGDGGIVTIYADRLEINEGRIDADTFGAGRAGSIFIAGNSLSLNDSSIQSSPREGSSGQAGAVDIAIANDILIENAEISIANNAVKSDLYSISPAAIIISAKNLFMTEGGIRSDSSGNLPAGNIILGIKDGLYLNSGSAISTVANNADGGVINIGDGKKIFIQNSAITTSVYGQSGNGGDIAITANGLILDSGFVQANTAASGASGGKVDIETLALIPSGSSLFIGGNSPFQFQPFSGLNVIQAAAPDGVSGTISTVTPQLNLNAMMTNLSIESFDSNALNRDMCEVSDSSSLLQSGRGAQPMRAKDLLLSPVF